MRQHVRSITQVRPAMAQFEEMIQFVGLLNAILGLFQNAFSLAEDVLDFFGMEPPQKDGET